MLLCTLINYVSVGYEHLVTQQLLHVSGTAMDTNKLPPQLSKIHHLLSMNHAQAEISDGYFNKNGIYTLKKDCDLRKE